MYNQGKGVIFDLATEDKVGHSQYRTYLARISKAIQEMLSQVTKTKNSHSKDDAITKSETALGLVMISDSNEHTMSVSEHETIMSSHTKTLLAQGELIRRQLAVMASAIENQGKAVNSDRVVLASICFSICKMLKYDRIPNDDSGSPMKAEVLSDDDDFLSPRTSPSTNHKEVTKEATKEATEEPRSATKKATSRSITSYLASVPSLFLKVITAVHRCICSQCDPKGYAKIKAEAKSEVLAEIEEQEMEAYKKHLKETHGSKWAEEARQEAMATNSEESIRAKLKEELATGENFLYESQLKLLQAKKKM